MDNATNIDCLNDAFGVHTGEYFSTRDKDNDDLGNKNCAVHYEGK